MAAPPSPLRALAAAFLAGAISCATAARLAAEPLTSHPRLLVTAADLPRLKSWAGASNPIYRDGLAVAATNAKADTAAGRVLPLASGGYSDAVPATEESAVLFAFLPLVSPAPAERDDYAKRARTLLMHVLDLAALGPADAPFRDPSFAIDNRSRW